MSTHDLIEQLLYEEESTSVDFKSEQYLFSGATDIEKAKLLKDILAFANAWRRIDAYIIIGVKEVKGGRSVPLGITETLDDAHLQQFVNSKTQRPIDFSYRNIEHDSVKLGLLHIPVQRRPFYLQKDFGKLGKSRVYIRRGSSTDEALPDEVSKMGEEITLPDPPAVLLEAFLIFKENKEDDEIIQKRINCKLVNATIPPPEEFPDYGVKYRDINSPISVVLPNYANNTDFYREYAAYAQALARSRLQDRHKKYRHCFSTRCKGGLRYIK